MDDYSARLLQSVTAVAATWATRLIDDRLSADGLLHTVTEESRRSVVAEVERLAIDGLRPGTYTLYVHSGDTLAGSSAPEVAVKRTIEIARRVREADAGVFLVVEEW